MEPYTLTLCMVLGLILRVLFWGYDTCKDTMIKVLLTLIMLPCALMIVCDLVNIYNQTLNY